MQPDFSKLGGLVPAVIQSASTKNILMVGFMNQEAYKKTLSTGLVTFFSRTRNKLWTKGEESGHFLKVISVHADCDNDTLLVLAEPNGPTCHLGNESCFADTRYTGISFLIDLEAVIESRKREMPENSYTTQLFREGVNRIAQKVGEEAVEVVVEAINNNRERLLNEAADLIYHFLVLLASKNLKLEDVVDILQKRHG
ncbi:MAG: bifunctional phosphoribosyl-AMP cyclohydrolase/phosphoribosyl-ATP diphosphatase HisIE [Bacteroidales bacterium]|nr:bifunctional phosphoribosyl-AMP cyclohydrolase/phosphoribosyl-ATP diphosphatase HisIE [Bacteroidales bacterium]